MIRRNSVMCLLLLSQELKCFFFELTGLYCPGCGITRLVLSLIQLDFYQAFRFNPLIFILIILSAIYIIYSLIRYKKIKQISNKLAIFLIIIVLIFTVLRNIKYFSFLAPTIVWILKKYNLMRYNKKKV